MKEKKKEYRVRACRHRHHATKNQSTKFTSHYIRLHSFWCVFFFLLLFFFCVSLRAVFCFLSSFLTRLVLERRRVFATFLSHKFSIVHIFFFFSLVIWRWCSAFWFLFCYLNHWWLWVFFLFYFGFLSFDGMTLVWMVSSKSHELANKIMHFKQYEINMGRHSSYTSIIHVEKDAKKITPYPKT